MTLTTRMWMWQQTRGNRDSDVCIFKRFNPLTVWMGQQLPDSAELAVAVHRDGVSRMRAVYDHRIRREKEAPDLGLDHFARHLPEYCALYPSIAHHCKPQSAWLGSDPNAFTDILPLDRLDLLPGLVGEVTGESPPTLPRYHRTEEKTPVSEEAAKWLREWTAHDTALGLGWGDPQAVRQWHRCCCCPKGPTGGFGVSPAALSPKPNEFKLAVMLESPPSITVLLLHHAADDLTRYHYNLLRNANFPDDAIRIVPICFAEYREHALPGSYVAVNPEAFRTNPLPAFQRFHHARGPLIPDLDCLIWDYVLHGGKRTDRIVLAEGDMLSRCGIREFFGPSFRHALSGSIVRRGVQANQDWYWYDKTPEEQRRMLGNHVASVTPVCGIQMGWDLAEKMAVLAHRSGGLFDNVHVEMAIATMARMLGVEPMETELSGGRVTGDFIHWRREELKLGLWGIFHPIKEIIAPAEAGNQNLGPESAYADRGHPPDPPLAL